MTAKEYDDCIGRWADDVMRFAVRCGGSREDSEDAVQEAFAAMWCRRGEVDVAKGKSFLFSAAYRQLLWRFRRRKTEGYITTDAVERMNEVAQAPDEGFDAKEAIAAAMATLPEVQRAILQLRDVEGYSYAEIGETLGLNDKQVQVYLFRERVAMRKQLNNLGYGKDR